MIKHTNYVVEVGDCHGYIAKIVSVASFGGDPNARSLATLGCKGEVTTRIVAESEFVSPYPINKVLSTGIIDLNEFNVKTKIFNASNYKVAE